MIPNPLNDVSSQLQTNDSNSLLAQILLELKVTNYLILNLAQYLQPGHGFAEEIGNIRASITASDINNPT